MRTINLEGLPEPVARAIEAFVDTLRRQLEPDGKKPEAVQLPYWPGIGLPLEQLRRSELHKDVR